MRRMFTCLKQVLSAHYAFYSILKFKSAFKFLRFNRHTETGGLMGWVQLANELEMDLKVYDNRRIQELYSINKNTYLKLN